MTCFSFIDAIKTTILFGDILVNYLGKINDKKNNEYNPCFNFIQTRQMLIVNYSAKINDKKNNE